MRAASAAGSGRLSFRAHRAGVAAPAAGSFANLLPGVQAPIARGFAIPTLVAQIVPRGLALAVTTLLRIEAGQVSNVSFQIGSSARVALIPRRQSSRPWLCRLDGQRSAHRITVRPCEPAPTSKRRGRTPVPPATYHFGGIQVWFIIVDMPAMPLIALSVISRTTGRPRFAVAPRPACRV